jgi:spore germination protein GerM
MTLKRAFFTVVAALACLLPLQTSNARTAAGNSAASNPIVKTQERRQVKVYFYHDPGEYIDLSPVKRYVSGASPARAAIEALLAGPTREEESKGFESLASADEFRLGSLKIKGGTARVNFVASRKWAGWPGDLAPVRFKTAVELTLKQFSNVQRVIVSLNGDPNFAAEG